MGRAFFNSAQTAGQAVTASAKRQRVALHVRHQPRDLEMLLTTEQVRVRLQLGSVDAVYRLVKERGLPRLDIGGVFRFRPSDVEQWIAEQNPVTSR